MGGCLNILLLKIIYYCKIFLNILRFVIPILLIIKLIIEIYKGIINNENRKNIIQNVYRKLIAAIVIFLVPTFVSIILQLINTTLDTPYSGIRQCLEFADPKYITELENNRDEEERELYLKESEKSLNKYEKMTAETRNIVQSKEQATTVGKPADSKNLIKCGTGNKYNTGLFNAIRSAGYKTREGVVAAAIYVSSHIDVHIPYFWSEGHFHEYDGYLDTGDNLIGVPDKWGCDVKMAFRGTDKQKNGVAYPFGTDCSGFLAWAIFNGGYYTGNKSQKIIVSTGNSPGSSIGDIKVSNIRTKEAKGKIKPGDIAFKKGHVGMIVEVSDSGFTVAEENGYDKGLIITNHTYNNSKFTHIILMDNFYTNYQKNTPLWNKFK